MAEVLRPEGRLDLAAVPAFHAALLAVRERDMVLDLGAVSHMGALCLQAALAAARSARGSGRSFALINVSDAVLGQLSAMGFTPETLAEGGP